MWRATCIYNQYDNLLTNNNTSPPPRSFDCKWGHFPLLQIINYTFFQKDNIRLNITPTMLAVLFQEVCECVCQYSCVCVGVDTRQALTNSAENETSPLIKKVPVWVAHRWGTGHTLTYTGRERERKRAREKDRESIKARERERWTSEQWSLNEAEAVTNNLI